jgi:hypothetical protein
MQLSGTVFAAAAILAATACGQGSDRADGQGEPASQHRAGHLGPVTYRYDPLLLTPANVRIVFPPAGEASVTGIKLVPTRGVGESPLCGDGRADCPVEEQPGLTLVLLERPFASYEEALREGGMGDAVRPRTVAGAEGIALDLGPDDGIEVEYRLAPVACRALLIELRLDGESAAEQRAIAQAVASIDLDG